MAHGKLVKAIILIRGGAEEPNMLSEWDACRHAVEVGDGGERAEGGACSLLTAEG